MSKTHLRKKPQFIDDDESLITSIYDFQPTNQDLYLYFAVDKTVNYVRLDDYRIVISKYYYESPTPDAPNPFFYKNWEWKVYRIPAGTSNIVDSENKIVAKIWTIYEYRFEYTLEADGSVDLKYLCDHVDSLDP